MLNITYYGHSAFMLSDGKSSIIIDPFLNENPLSIIKAKDIKADFIIITHGHGDHFGDTLEIAENNNATVIAVNELANYCVSKGANAHGMHIGGSYNFPFGKVKFTIAHHGSIAPDGTFTGPASGVIVTIDGKNVYHCGDTGLFLDMKLIGELTPIDYMLIPIGDNFTMGIDDAVKAVEFVNPKTTIPMHYNTWKVISSDPDLFANKLDKIGKQSIIMQPGETIDV
jgi:L-ascorbate metabolism protein UlaG (beta-lactamase superfamily)